MHPREGWSEGGIRRRPDPLESAISRRQLLAAGAGVALGAMLAGCGGSGSNASSGASSSGGIPLPRQDSPVKWPIFADNKPIASGLAPEKGATLEIYNWVAYINEAVIKSFCKKHNCNYSLTTFNTMEEAISKLASGQLKFDVFFPTVDVLGQLIEAKFIRPLNQSYIPNIDQRLARLSKSVLRPGLAVHDPVLDLHHRDGVAQGQGEPHPVVEHAVGGGGVQGQGCRPRRRPRDDRPGAAEGRQPEPQHDRHGPDPGGRQVAAAARQPDQRPDRQQRLHRCTDRQDLDPPRLVGRHGGRRTSICPRARRSTRSVTGSRPTTRARSPTT